jgi:hypothetical protein
VFLLCLSSTTTTVAIVRRWYSKSSSASSMPLDQSVAECLVLGERMMTLVRLGHPRPE